MDGQVRSQLEKNWTGIYAPVLLTGQLTILAPPKNTLSKAKKEFGKFIGKRQKVYIEFNQELYGMPSEHLAINNDWIFSGQMAGS